MSQTQRYRLIVAPIARRQLETLPGAVASAAYEFVIDTLLDNRIG